MAVRNKSNGNDSGLNPEAQLQDMRRSRDPLLLRQLSGKMELNSKAA
jgi:hypothetical protein